ncbi:MAG: DUF3307 domain-containing protein [Rhodobacteraceae bacterium]|nr:DUF3307 domain-containing protein [Paracoccaceae bacterium]
MTETFAALLLAHVLADFVFQTGWIATRKQARDPVVLALHGAIVLSLAIVGTGNWHWGLAVLAAAHLAIDLGKSFARAHRLWPFLADQAAHLLTIGLAAALLPGLWVGGAWATGGWPTGWWPEPLWPEPAWAPGLMAALAGLLIAARAGGFAVGLLMQPFSEANPGDGLPKGGAVIGLLERGLIYLLIMAGQSAGIGFLIAAKSVLRFDATSKDRSASEYVIIGTLASFGWAMTAGWATLALLKALSPIGIPALTP